MPPAPGSPRPAWTPMACATVCAGIVACWSAETNSTPPCSSVFRNSLPETRRFRGVTTPGLILDRLTLFYGAQPLFEDVSLIVPAGQFVALLGPSGVGKTSLLKIAAGLLRPASGVVRASDG